MSQIGCFGHTLDPLFVNEKIKQRLTVFIPADNESLKALYRGFHVVVFRWPASAPPIEDQSDGDLLKRKAVSDIIKSKGVEKFLISHRATKPLHETAGKLNIQLLGNSYTWAERFENKLYFDRLMKSLQVLKPLTLSNPALKKSPSEWVVVQNPESFGSFGTKILTAKRALRILGKRSVPRLLVRQFIAGRVFGISVFVDKKNAVFSGLREQCYYPPTTKTPLFAGIQWVPKKSLSEKATVTIEKIFRKITTAVQKKGITGILNFDFILNKQDQVFVLECNPRPSSATPQILMYHQLTHGVDTSDFLIGNTMLRKNYQSIPTCNFEGALFDLMAAMAEKNPRRPKPYQSTPDGLFIYAPRSHQNKNPEVASIKSGEFLGMILSDTRLFDADAKPNPYAQKLYQNITGIDFPADAVEERR